MPLMPIQFSPKRLAIAAAALVVILLLAGALIYRDDIISTTLDPKEPFQTYDPPAAPNYVMRSAWAQLPADPDSWTVQDGPADIFFVHPTTFDGGEDWNGPIDEKRSDRLLQRTMLPNYAGPFQQVGRVFAPRYRQAGLYSFLTNRDDARDARRFAYGDVLAAFQQFRVAFNRGRPIVIVGVEQGAQLAARLAAEIAAADPALLQRIAAVYLIEAVVPAEQYGPGSALPACTQRTQARCVVGWVGVREGDEEAAASVVQRAFVWNGQGQLVPLQGRMPLCVNPLTGAADTIAEARANLGAANATGMEWGARPGFLPRQASAACRKGLLRTSEPTSPSLRISGAWTDQRKVAPYNLFYADLEADAKARVAALLNRSDFPQSAPSIESAVTLGANPIHRIN
jgi:hypothetical protein